MNELLTIRSELQSKYQNSNFRIDVPTMNLGCIHGGDNPNRICGQCELEFDLRPLPGMSMDGLRNLISDRLKPIEQKHRVDLSVRSLFPGIPPFEQSESEFVACVERLTGHKAEAVAFGTEAPFLQQMGMQTLVLGPGSIDQAHQPDEFLALDQFAPTLDLLHNLINQYCVKGC
jgi:acetylornithine deacetylase